MRKNEDVGRIAEVARLYYKEGKTQAEIGKLLGVSHSTISRMLKQAHEQKIVEVLIRQPIQLISDLSEQLEKRLSLKKAYVVYSSGVDSDESLNQLAHQAALVLSNILRDGIRLGFSTGSTVATTLQCFKGGQPRDVQVVPLHGIKEELPGNGSNFYQLLIKQFSRNIITFPAPWLMQSMEASQLIVQEKAVSSVIQLAESADVGLIGIGGLDDNSSEIFRNGWISPDEFAALREAGAVGEICGKFFDQEGQVLDIPINKRLIAIDLNSLRGFDKVLAVAGSKNKAKAILGAIRGRLINILVTDSDAAKEILNLADSI